MNEQEINDALSARMSRIGALGGQAGGPKKRRGNAEHYRRLAERAHAVRYGGQRMCEVGRAAQDGKLEIV